MLDHCQAENGVGNMKPTSDCNAKCNDYARATPLYGANARDQRKVGSRTNYCKPDYPQNYEKLFHGSALDQLKVRRPLVGCDLFEKRKIIC